MKAGLTWGCLDFRHTFGTHLARNGVSLFKISKLLGNSPAICQLHYSNVMPEELTKEVELVASG
jgi:site-specific recombinase XerD